MKSILDRIGLIVIGTEILDGRRQEKHFKNIMDLLKVKGGELIWYLVLPDNPEIIKFYLGWAFNQNYPFFCCGGIGSTPDDYTRSCIAEVLGVNLVLHKEAERILKEKFGKDCTPERLSMVEFPRGANLIPNPINQIPGFYIKNGFFFPGFPEMAKPMMEWVLSEFFLFKADRIRAGFICICRESELIPLYRALLANNPEVELSSLPSLGDDKPRVEVWLKGDSDAVNKACKELREFLNNTGIEWYYIDKE